MPARSHPLKLCVYVFFALWCGFLLDGLRYDYCLALDEEASLGCGETQAFCPTQPYVQNASGPPPALTCDRCALLTMEDWNEQIWLGGEVRWAPFAQSEEEELQLKGYLDDLKWRNSRTVGCTEMFRTGLQPLRPLRPQPQPVAKDTTWVS